MEENVALDSTKQRKFNKSIKGIKKLLKKNEDKPHKPAVLAPKDDENKEEKKKKKRPDRGLVYLSHIPHGFYEHEMTQYFKQFGMVTNVRVIRSPRTGRSKGFAFVEFREPAVAEIVAETMNNYLMGKRLIKAAIIPPEKQKHKAFRKYWNTKHNPTINRRIKERKAHNAGKTDDEHLKKAKKMLLNLQKTKKKLNDLGIDYDFFKPVDVPKLLADNMTVQTETQGKAVKIKSGTVEKQNKKKKNAAQTAEKLTKEKKPETNPNTAGKGKKEVKKPQESDKAKQNEKQKKMQAAGVKLPENFIKIAEEESDSSLDFDSDEYEKMLANDSEESSGDESDDDDDDDGEEESDEESEEEIPQLIPIHQKKGKKPLVALPQPKKTSTAAIGPKAQKPQPKGIKPAVPQGPKAPVFQQGAKRKNLQPETSPKKPKFEKQDKKARNKQFKKKNKA